MLFLSEYVGIRSLYSSSNEWLNRHIHFTHLQVFLVFMIPSLTYMIQKKTTKNQKEFRAGDYWRTWGLFGMF